MWDDEDHKAVADADKIQIRSLRFVTFSAKIELQIYVFADDEYLESGDLEQLS